jgi:hypothetical protein
MGQRILIVTKNLGFCSVSKSTNTLLTMINGQVFCILIWQPSSRGISNPPPGDTLSNSLRLLLGNPHQHMQYFSYIVAWTNFILNTFKTLRNKTLFFNLANQFVCFNLFCILTTGCWWWFPRSKRNELLSVSPGGGFEIPLDEGCQIITQKTWPLIIVSNVFVDFDTLQKPKFFVTIQPSSREISNPPPGDTQSNSLRLLLGNHHQHPVVRMQNKLKQTNWFAKLKNSVLFLRVLNVLRIKFVQATI